MCQQDLVNDGAFGHHVKIEHTICQVLGRRLRETPTDLAVQVVVSARFTQNAGGLAYSYGDGMLSFDTAILGCPVCWYTATHARVHRPRTCHVTELFSVTAFVGC